MPIVFPTIRLRRGLRSSLPVLALGELGFCTDTNELFIGTSAGNRLIYPYIEHFLVLNPIDATNTWYTPYITNSTALTTLALTASRIYFIPFIVPARVTVTGLAINVTTAAAGTAQVGIYDSANFRPNSLLGSVTNLDTGTTGVKSGNVNVPLIPGRLYWVALATSAAATVRAGAVGGVQTIMGINITGTAYTTHYFASGSTLPNPAPATALTVGTGTIPIVFMRFSV